MKKIKLKHLTEPVNGSPYTRDKFYYVNLGRGIKKQFTNRAQAEKYLNEVSRYLSYKMVECNELYITAFALYRRAWFYFDASKFLQGQNKLGQDFLQRECENALDCILRAFDLMYMRHDYANANYFVFAHFENIFSPIEKICNALKKIYEKKSVPAQYMEIEILRQRNIHSRRTVENFQQHLRNASEAEASHDVELEIIHMAV